ncbi:unnamed protein product [Calicophoron daubneyi]|uniref:SURP motif domain-containing protein n=2 Tax=Calicophoron daubneyi TaxID=300641 RepID=A0AAV2T6D8_CALDB
MNEIPQPPKEIPVLERNLPSVAYKNAIGAMGSSLQTLSSMKQNSEEEDSAAQRALNMLEKNVEEEHKIKGEDEQTKQVFREPFTTLEEAAKLRTLVEGRVFSTKSCDTSVDAPSVGHFYKLVSKSNEKSSRSESTKALPKVLTGEPEKPLVGKGRGQEQENLKLEQFKEEPEFIGRRRGQRYVRRQGRSSISIGHFRVNLCNVGGMRLDYRNFSALNQYNSAVENSSSSGFYSRCEMRNRQDDCPYGFDNNRTTKNSFLENLNLKMTEQQLCKGFKRLGLLDNVKYARQRTDEEHPWSRNRRLVAIMNRQNGKRALDNIRGKELFGFERKWGWDKSVPIPMYPICVPRTLFKLAEPIMHGGPPFNAQPRKWLKSALRAIKERAEIVADGTKSLVLPRPDRKPPDINEVTSKEPKEVLKEAAVKVAIPSDGFIPALIQRMIEFVVIKEPQCESAIMHQDQNNAKLRFLFDYQSSERTYCWWTLWFILDGDNVGSWWAEEFRVLKGGVPKVVIEQNGYNISRVTFRLLKQEAVAIQIECMRIHIQRLQRFLDVVASLKLIVSVSIRCCRIWSPPDDRVVMWCLEHADLAVDISGCVIKSLSLTQQQDAAEDKEKSATVVLAGGTEFTVAEIENSDSPHGSLVTKPVTRLFPVPGILYNPLAKILNASYARKRYREHLQGLFELRQLEYEDVEGKLKAERLKQKTMVCFKTLEAWAVYWNDCLIKLQNIIPGLVTEIDDETKLTGEPPASNVVQVSVTDDPNVRNLAINGAHVEVPGVQQLVPYDGYLLCVDDRVISGEETTAMITTPAEAGRSPLIPNHLQLINCSAWKYGLSEVQC